MEKEIEKIMQELKYPYFDRSWKQRITELETADVPIDVKEYFLNEESILNRDLFSVPEEVLKEIYRKAQINILKDLKLGVEKDYCCLFTKNDMIKYTERDREMMADGHRWQRLKFINHLKKMIEVLEK